MRAQVVVIDEAMALAGSLNLDSRSFFLNYEMMDIAVVMVAQLCEY